MTHEQLRKSEIDLIYECDPQTTISMQMAPQAGEEGFLDDEWDEDEDEF